MDKNIFTNINIILTRFILKVFYIIPIKRNKIFFSSYEGKQYSCNPKYIFEKIRQIMPDLQYVYEYNDREHIPVELKDNVIVVVHNSIRYFFELLTAKIIVTNSGITAKVPIRRKQVLIDTRHAGGAYKRVGKDISSVVNGSNSLFISLSERQTTYFISSCRKSSEVTSGSNGVKEDKYLNIGLPRNDIFYISEKRKQMIDRKVRALLGIAVGMKIVLYAPTYRGNAGKVSKINTMALDEEVLIKALCLKFGGNWCLVFRGHYFGMSYEQEANKYVNASDYPDMQELLVAVDVLITDYSSVVWDYSLTDKPGFLYTPDLQEYEESRGFYVPISEWPYEYATTNAELVKLIENYDKGKQVDRNKAHHDNLGSYESGHATEKVVDLIINRLEN